MTIPEEFSDMQRLVDELKEMAKHQLTWSDSRTLLAAADYIPQLWDAGFRAGKTSSGLL